MENNKKNALLDQFKAAIEADNVASALQLLKNKSVCDEINASIFPYGRPPLLAAQSSQMVDLLIEYGASVDKVSEFWAPGFWVDTVCLSVSEQLLKQGAKLTIHAAAALGLCEEVHKILNRDPTLVQAPGGDGASPLHFARTVEIAKLLMEYGADLEARDEDHRSTPAQWRLKTSPEVTRYLLNNGATPDVFLAVGLGDLELTTSVLAADPKCVCYRIGDNTGPYPGISFEGTGGTILQWQLGFNTSPQEIAKKRGHHEIYELLMATTPPKHKLQIACMLADQALAMSLLKEFPNLVETFNDEDKTLLAKACWETNNDTEAIRLMLECGFPVGIPEHNHGFSPLHNAAWCGNSEVVRLLLKHGHPVDIIDPQYKSSAVGYAIHSATEARKYTDVDYPGVVDTLVSAGLTKCLEFYPIGHEAIDAILKKHLDKKK